MYFDVKYHSPCLKLFSALLCTRYTCNNMLYTIKIRPWAMKQLLKEGVGGRVCIQEF